MRSATPDRRSSRRPAFRGVVATALIGAAALLAAAMPAAAQTPATIPPPAATPRDTVARNVGVLRPGDILDVVVFRDKELSNKYLIDSRGFVQIPGLGVIPAAGLDPTQVKARLEESLRARGFERPELSVQPLIRVSVLGQVRTPGLYPVDPGTSLIQLVTIAGGPVGEANLRKTTVVREGRAYTVDLESALAGSPAGRIVLYSNDYVVVPKKTGFTRENMSLVFGALGALLSVANILVTLSK
ncbi:MAG TPA: polysaccharide biosynthesis/export family protein [Gaiellaceae bacterium]|nr:polysaccharide biosynthesis/export family protein [Gaiellaceae bacterium]